MPAPSHENPPSRDPRDKRVLIVDDDEGVLGLIEFIVTDAGFQAIKTDTGEAGIAALAQKPDAIILDLMMPGCGGLGVLKHLKTVPTAHPPIIVITAYEKAHPTVKDAMMDPLVTQCLSKPIDNQALAAALHGVLKTQPLKKR